MPRKLARWPLPTKVRKPFSTETWIDNRSTSTQCCLSKLKVCRQEKKRKKSQGVERFCAGQLYADLNVLSACMISCIYSAPFLETDSDLDWESLSHFASSSNKPTPTGILNFPYFRDFIPCWSRILVAPGLPRPFYLSRLLMIGFGRPCQLAQDLLFGP